MIDDLIGRAEAQTAIQFAARRYTVAHEAHGEGQVVWSDNLINVTDAMNVLRDLPSAQPERLTDDDFETIRIHLNAYKEKLCNQQRWEEAEEYQRIIDRFMAFASAQPETNCPEIPNNWIPCSKRHPDKEGDYLVTLWDDRGTWVEIALWNETFGGRWQAVLYNDVDYSDISNVIAWKPLPEPYREGEQE